MPVSLQFAALCLAIWATTLAAAPQVKQNGKPGVTKDITKEVTKVDRDPSGESIFEGKLIDAECHGEDKCRVSARTVRFGLILIDGTYLKFDEGGNSKVKLFLGESPQGRKMLKAKPDAAKRMTVKAKGIRTGDTFNLESIQ